MSSIVRIPKLRVPTLELPLSVGLPTDPDTMSFLSRIYGTIFGEINPFINDIWISTRSHTTEAQSLLASAAQNRDYGLRYDVRRHDDTVNSLLYLT